MCKAAGVRDLIMCDTKGVIHAGRTDLTDHKRRHASDTSARTLTEAFCGAHVFIGVSVANCVTAEEIRSMGDYPAIFAMSNPDPEVRPEIVAEALGNKPYVMATGRSDFPNQVNNVLGFPFLFRGALDVKAKTINTAMKVAASEALAGLAREAVPADVQALYPNEKLVFGNSYIIPKPFDRRLFVEVSYAVAKAAVESGVAPATDLAALKASLIARNAARV
jgi:malate dehydrogenase (oxaloacetate-decarboxylating)(NADP+)